MKNLKWNLILMSLLYLALGIFLLAVPGVALNIVCYALGGVVLAQVLKRKSVRQEAEKRETGKALAQCLVVVPSCGPMVEQGFHALSLRLEFVISKRYPDKIP